MKKKKLLTTVLASLIAINTLGGCANKSAETECTKSEIAEETKGDLEPQVDIIELPLDDTLLDEDIINVPGCKILERNAKVTSIDMSDNPFYTIAFQIVTERSYPTGVDDTDVKDVYDFLKFVNADEVYSMLEYELDDYIFVGDVAYKVEIEDNYTYPAVKSEKDGKTIYSAPYGGILQGGTTVLNSRTILLNEEWTLLFLEEYGYVENDNLKLKNTL